MFSFLILLFISLKSSAQMYLGSNIGISTSSSLLNTSVHRIEISSSDKHLYASNVLGEIIAGVRIDNHFSFEYVCVLGHGQSTYRSNTGIPGIGIGLFTLKETLRSENGNRLGFRYIVNPDSPSKFKVHLGAFWENTRFSYKYSIAHNLGAPTQYQFSKNFNGIHATFGILYPIAPRVRFNVECGYSLYYPYVKGFNNNHIQQVKLRPRFYQFKIGIRYSF